MGKNRLGQKILDFYAQRYQDLAGVPKLEPYPSIGEMLAYLATVPDYVFSLYGFARDPLKEKVSEAEKKELLERCMQDGQHYGETILEQYPGMAPSQIAHALGLQVLRPEMPHKGSQVVFADFEEPRTIRVYQNTIRHANETIQQESLQSFFDGINLEEVLIAHELFHTIEMLNKDTIFTLNHKIVLWHIGSFKYTSSLPSLREITAMRFAKTLTGLPFSPYLLEVFFTYSYNQDAGGSLYNEIKRLAANVPDSHGAGAESKNPIDN